MKPRILILAITTFLIYSCNWFKKPEYYEYYYIPDSLHFPMETGDTAIFSCKTDDTVIYDTFYIVKDVSMGTTYESMSIYNPIGEVEVEEVYYKNDKVKCILIINPFRTEPFLLADWPQYNTCSGNGKKHIFHLVINGVDYYNIIKYNSLYGCDSVHQLFNIYFNTRNGLLKYTTTDSLTFELFAYKKLQCGVSE